MKNKYVFVAVLLSAILVISMGFTNIYVGHHQPTEEEDFVVVTSFYPMYIAAMNVIGDAEGVTLKSLSEPQTGCLHDFQLTPADMKLLSTADVFIINGGGIESFMEEIAVQYPELKIIEACKEIELLGDELSHEEVDDHDEESHSEDMHEELHGADEEAHNHDVNAHAWMSVALYRQQIAAIAEGLAEADPVNREGYLANAGIYDTKLEALQDEQKELFTFTNGQSVVLLHCAYDYVAMDMGLEEAFCMDLDEERQVSAGEVAQILEVIAHEGVRYILAEELYGASMCEMIQKEVDVEVIYLDPLNRGEYHVDSYLEGMRENLKRVAQTMNYEGTE